MNRIELMDVTDNNLTLLREINSTLFPSAPYNYFFYISLLDDDDALNKIIYYDGKVAGAVTGRPEFTTRKIRQFYILTLGILPSYRRLGLGKILMNSVISHTYDNGPFDSIFLHVHVCNEAAIKFYSNFGFEILEKVDSYYKTFEPPAALLLQKDLKNTIRKPKKREKLNGKVSVAPNSVIVTKTRLRKMGNS